MGIGDADPPPAADQQRREPMPQTRIHLEQIHRITPSSTGLNENCLAQGSARLGPPVRLPGVRTRGMR
jgi:hypothetical protein